MATEPVNPFETPGFEDCFAPAERCWCGWTARSPSPFSPHYHCCARCGTHYSDRRIRPGAVARFYGNLIGARYGEPFVVKEAMQIEDIVSMGSRSI